MLSKKMAESLNEQINAELFSGYLYLSMSAYFKNINLEGFANWMYVQAREEYAHAMKFYNFIIERGATVRLLPLEGPQTEWASVEKVFEDSYAHEQYITERINNLVDMAISEKDHATNAMLQWFVSEQVEEEANASAVLEKIRLTGSKGSGIFMIDRELAQRIFDAAEYE